MTLIDQIKYFGPSLLSEERLTIFNNAFLEEERQEYREYAGKVEDTADDQVRSQWGTILYMLIALALSIADPFYFLSLLAMALIFITEIRREKAIRDISEEYKDRAGYISKLLYMRSIYEEEVCVSNGVYYLANCKYCGGGGAIYSKFMSPPEQCGCGADAQWLMDERERIRREF